MKTVSDEADRSQAADLKAGKFNTETWEAVSGLLESWVSAGYLNEDVLKQDVNGKKILPMYKLQDYLERTNVHIGIITVPASFAQQVADLLVNAGIKAIWNFAPTHIIVPDDVVIKNEDMAASLAILSNKLKELYER